MGTRIPPLRYSAASIKLAATYNDSKFVRYAGVGFALALFLSGCGGTEGLGRVAGKVTLDGKPLADASIEFTPVDGKGLTSYGRSDANGQYYMMATRTEKGAAVGKNSVRITTYEVIDLKTTLPERVPTKYNTATELERDVKSGSNAFDFELSTEGGKVVNKKRDPGNQ